MDFKQRSTLWLVYPFSKWKSIFNRINKLSIRKPERTSQARAAPVNHPVTEKFSFVRINNNKFQAEDIFNCDETNISSWATENCCRDWSEGGILILNFVPAIYNKARILWFIQVSTTKSQKQGTNETMLASVNASGNYFPGVFVFPRVNVNLDQSSRRFIPLAHKTGWMTSELLLISLQHLEKQISNVHQKNRFFWLWTIMLVI